MNQYKNLGREEFKGTYNKYTQYYNILKKYNKLFLANIYKKESWFYDQKVVAAYLKKEMTFQEIIEYCINLDGDLEEGYDLLQSLYKIARYSSFDSARKDILDWCFKIEHSDKCIKEFNKVVLTYKSWLNEIVNSFIINPITKARMTNGFIEGKNNMCKVIKRVGFGYKNFDTFRAKILYNDDDNRPFKN